MEREIKFRAWDAANKEMNFADIRETDEMNEWVTWKNPIGSPQNTGSCWDIMRYTTLTDKSGEECCAGDLRMYEGKMYKLIDEGFRFSLERNMVDFGENERIIFDEDVSYTSYLIGNIHQNPDLIK